MWHHRGIDNSTSSSLYRHTLLLTIGILAVSPAMADEFTLNTGKVVKGAIVSQTDAQYVIQTEIGTLKVAKSDVVRTVDLGTTPVEIEGDIALKNGDFVKAKASFEQALKNVGSNTLAAGRLQTKIQKLSSTTQQLAQSQLVQSFNQAVSMVEARNFDTASVILSELRTNLSPDDPLTSRVRQLEAQVHFGKGMAALDAVKLDLAQEQLEAAIAADPSFYPAYLTLGDSLLGNSATVSRGIELLEQGLEAGGQRISEQQRYAYQYKLAEKYFAQGMYGDAATTFAALIPARDKYPSFADALDRAVESYVRMGEENMSSDFQETIVNLNHALQLNPSNQKALFLLGRIYLDLGQIENSIVTLQRLVDMQPNYPEAQHYLGRAYFQLHDNESAISHLNIEIENNPDNYFALTDRAEAFIETDKYAAAKADLAAAKAIDATHWLAYYLTGLLAYNEENYDTARTALLEALDHKRTAMPVHLLMARVLVAQNQVEGARQWLEQVAESLRDVQRLSYKYKVYLADALTQLGEISVIQNSPRQAQNYLQEALQTMPEHIPARVALADTKLLLVTDAFASASSEQLYAEAEKLYLDAIEADPDNPEYYLKLATFYRSHKKDNEKARTYYNLYVDKGGRDPQINTWLAQVGGTPRQEIAAETAMVNTLTTGAVVTTATVATGPGGVMMTTTTATVPVQPGGIVLPVDAMMAESSGAAAVTTAVNTMPVTVPATQPGAAPAGAPVIPPTPAVVPVAPGAAPAAPAPPQP